MYYEGTNQFVYKHKSLIVGMRSEATEEQFASLLSEWVTTLSPAVLHYVADLNMCGGSQLAVIMDILLLLQTIYDMHRPSRTFSLLGIQVDYSSAVLTCTIGETGVVLLKRTICTRSCPIAYP